MQIKFAFALDLIVSLYDFSNEMTPISVLLTVSAYIAALFAVAWFSGRKADNAGFFTGNRRTAWWMAAMAMIGAAMSGVTFISVPGSVATDSFSYMQMVAGFTVGQMIVAFVLIPVFYRLRVVSLYEYLDSRFGMTAHRTGAWVFFLAKMPAAALKVYVVCTVMQILVFDAYGIPLWANAAATMALVWAYTRRGGVKSLIWTDMLHTLCLLAAITVGIICIVRALGFSAADAAAAVAGSGYSRILVTDPSSARCFWKMFAAGVFSLVAMTGLDQDMMQRNMSCRTPRDAQINIVITAAAQIAVIFFFLVLGALLYIYADSRGLQLPGKSDQVFPAVAVNGGLPTAVGVLFVLGLVASTWSAAGSALTALTTSFTLDIMPRSQQLGEKALSRRRRGVHAAMAVVMWVAILLFDRWGNDSVINLVFKVVSYTYGPILGMFGFGLLTRIRIRDRRMPAVALAAPLLSALLQQTAARKFGYGIGFELLIYNALFTAAGMLLLRRSKETTH